MDSQDPLPQRHSLYFRKDSVWKDLKRGHLPILFCSSVLCYRWGDGKPICVIQTRMETLMLDPTCHQFCLMHTCQVYEMESSGHLTGLPWWLSGKESTCNAGDLSSFPGSGRSLGGEHDNPLWYSCLENPTDREAWWATIQRVE